MPYAKRAGTPAVVPASVWGDTGTEQMAQDGQRGWGDNKEDKRPGETVQSITCLPTGLRTEP